MLRVEVEAELRIQVDELMREELKNLKLVCLSVCLLWSCIINNLLRPSSGFPSPQRPLTKTRAKEKRRGRRKQRKGRCVLWTSSVQCCLSGWSVQVVMSDPLRRARERKERRKKRT